MNRHYHIYGSQMTKRTTSLVILLVLFFWTSLQGDDYNTSLIGRWVIGPCVALTNSGNHLYFGKGSSMVIADFSDPTNLVEEGSVNFPAIVSDVEVAGSYAYVAARNKGLRIIDISDSSNPIEVGSHDSLSYVREVVISGNYAYLATNPGMRIIDITDPSAPVEAGRVETEGSHNAICSQDNYAYLAEGDYG